MMNLRRALLLTALAHATLPLRALANPNAAAADTIGRDLRKLFLSTRAADLGLRPDSGTPPVFGAAFDWPVGTQFATMSFAGGASTATFTAASDTDFAGGDVLTVVSPNPADSTLADIGFSLAGVRL